MNVIRKTDKFFHHGTYFIALGANLDGPDGCSPRQSCERALHAMRRINGLTLEARSRWFSTAPIPAGDQPRYINGVVRLSGKIVPSDLLAALQGIEKAAGRRRGAADAARTLDLDIIDMDGLLRPAPDPVLPHPRAHLRAFVLLPLRDVAPDWRYPGTGETIHALIARLDPQDISPL